MAEKTIGDLQRRSREVAPLPQRRNPPQQPLPVDSICDWDSGEVQAQPPRPGPARLSPCLALPLACPYPCPSSYPVLALVPFLALAPEPT